MQDAFVQMLLLKPTAHSGTEFVRLRLRPVSKTMMTDVLPHQPTCLTFFVSLLSSCEGSSDRRVSKHFARIGITCSTVRRAIFATLGSRRRGVASQATTDRAPGLEARSPLARASTVTSALPSIQDVQDQGVPRALCIYPPRPSKDS